MLDRITGDSVDVEVLPFNARGNCKPLGVLPPPPALLAISLATNVPCSKRSLDTYEVQVWVEDGERACWYVWATTISKREGLAWRDEMRAAGLTVQLVEWLVGVVS